ncbi:HMG box-containing protein [Gaeumannomyces tritici R3-111a-1]|uniref:HMG box-containing protein n=1 Tax=Gaeumannomyces tritici (strain R3-111a-1) TaxID=644352 RepID=J3NWS4_GAET3|nr:HMG box-containing protein [Gaeumannomyces tritici R3-111a-1]EJT75806.1 HMG box-containing protein [Gaeumannomyces tritici R3-111a-1]
MARVWADEESEDELPSVNQLLRQKAAIPTKSAKDSTGSQNSDDSPREATVRRRKLGQAVDNPLLRPLGKNLEPSSQRGGNSDNLRSGGKREDVGGPRVELRARKPRAAAANVKTVEAEEEESEGETIVEEVTIVDDSVYFSLSSSDEDSFDDLSEPDPPPRSKPTRPSRGTKSGLSSEKEPPKDVRRNIASKAKVSAEKLEEPSRREKGAPKAADTRRGPESTSSSTKSKDGDQPKASGGNGSQEVDKKEKSSRRSDKPSSLTKGLAESLSSLRLEPTPPPETQNAVRKRPETPPPSTPPKVRPNVLVSPSKKPPRIPMTPHGPGTDAFWDQEVTDEWNDKHSPRKLFASPAKAVARGPEKKEKGLAAKQREAKKSFEATRHGTAERFLRELDRVITMGKLGELAASTGGVRIQWTNKLNTTAGRASWRRETVRTRHRAAAGSAGAATETVTHRHHASIELAEKVIDSEDRLLNVLAHEFCHLANFMVSGVTGNPHGREFKAWAAACSRAFGDRGIAVTTKHSYDIDFKYVWECAECALEYKRHSKSVDPRRHRCGVCKGELVQIKPKPRGGAGAAAGTAVGAGLAGGEKRVPSEYQKFMSEHMKLIRQEHPGSPQKEVMKLVAERWAKTSKKTTKTRGKAKAAEAEEQDVDDVVDGLVSLNIQDS